MEDDKKAEANWPQIAKVIADRAKIDELKASTEEVKAQADKERRRSLELRAAFYEKLAALAAGSIAVAVSVGVALFVKASPHSVFLRSNLSWLVVIAFFLWLSLVSAVGHNALFIKIARLEADKAEEWSKWIGLINASAMQAVVGTADSELSEDLDKLIADTAHGRITEGAMNQHQTEQSNFGSRVLGFVAIGSFLIAYTLAFICLIRLWCLAH